MYRIECHSEKIAEEDFLEYRRLCALFEQVTEWFIRNEEMFFLEATVVIFQAFAILLQSFSEKIPLEPTGRDVLSRERIRRVITFTDAELHVYALIFQLLSNKCVCLIINVTNWSGS